MWAQNCMDSSQHLGPILNFGTHILFELGPLDFRQCLCSCLAAEFGGPDFGIYKARSIQFLYP